MSLGTRLYTWWRGELVGTDQYGNQYFREKGQKPLVKGGGMESRERRWVIYRGIPEASKVPPQWHGWLHHSERLPPDEASLTQRQSWQKEHLPNLTGTVYAYHPGGSVLAQGERAPATGDYEAWTPDGTGS